MADLDDFFKKKDKKKVKGKKFNNTEEMAKRLEETEKKIEKEQKKTADTLKKAEEKKETVSENTLETAAVPETANLRKEEEEWNDYKDENDKDYSDLKITKLALDNPDDVTGTGDDDEDEGPDGEKKDGVWKSATPASQAVEEEEEEEEEEKETVAPISSTPSSYVPPHMRNASGSALPKAGGRRNKEAPDISNEMSFPSLSDAQAANPLGAWGKRKAAADDRNLGFESVRGGSSRMSQESSGGPKLSTANRFDALSTDAS